MKLITFALLTSAYLTLSGCGSFLAGIESNPIEDDPGERTFGQFIEDNNIETKAIVNIHAADEAFHEAHISVVAYNGYVLVAGQVQSDELKQKATAVIREIRDVRRIYNELDIAAPSSGITRTSDTWITAKVKSYLIGSTQTEGTRVKVLTENGVVYLMGLATQAEAERISEKAASLGGVQRVVKLFELID